MRRIATLCLLFFATTTLAADRDLARYERLLLPFTGGVSGAGGGFWFTQWWIRNDADTAVDVFPLAFVCGLCPPSFRYSVAGPIAPRSTPMYIPGDVLPGPKVPLGLPLDPSPPGAFLYVERGKTAQLAITGFLGRATPTTAFRRSVASALRPVPDSGFRTGRQSIVLPFVAADARYALRVYAAPETLDAPGVTVRTFAISEIAGLSPEDETSMATATASLFEPDSQGFRAQCAAPCDVPFVPYKPAVAEISLGALLGNAKESAVRVEIEPASPNVRFWAVISATSNSADQVQLFPLSDM